MRLPSILLIAALVGCKFADARPAVVVEELATQAVDSVKYRVSWTAPSGTVTNYQLRLLRGPDTLVAHQLAGARLVDTVATVRPSVATDSIGPMKVIVRALNCPGAGIQCANGPFASTSSWYIKMKAIAPGTPGGLGVDTLASVMQIFVRPNLVAVTPGVTIQLCAFAVLSDGTTEILGQPESVSVCMNRYNSWLAERNT